LWFEWFGSDVVFPRRSLDRFSDRFGGRNGKAIRASADNNAFRLRDG
jgi:hypothetical protein